MLFRSICLFISICILLSVFSVAVSVGLNEKTVESWRPNYVSFYRQQCLAKQKRGRSGKLYNLRKNSAVSWPWRIGASCSSLLYSHKISCFHTSRWKNPGKQQLWTGICKATNPKLFGSGTIVLLGKLLTWAKKWFCSRKDGIHAIIQHKCEQELSRLTPFYVEAVWRCLHFSGTALAGLWERPRWYASSFTWPWKLLLSCMWPWQSFHRPIESTAVCSPCHIKIRS